MIGPNTSANRSHTIAGFLSLTLKTQRGSASERSGQEEGCQEDWISDHHRFRWLRGIRQVLIFLTTVFLTSS